MAEAPSGALTIVVVSDDPAIRAETCYGFTSRVDVRVARDSKDGLDLLEGDPPDAVIVDLQTGNAGGFNLAHEMRQEEKLRNVPVLVLIDRPQDAWLALQSGATAYLTKPLDAAALADAVLQIVRAG